VVRHGGRLFYLGGAIETLDSGEAGYDTYRTHADVWVSADGADWRLLTDAPGWEPRMWHSAISYRGRIWLYGGYSNRRNANLGDLWVSRDGMTWTEVPAGAERPEPRHFPTMFAHPDTGIVVAAGNAWPVVDDVWAYRNAATAGIGWLDRWIWRWFAPLLAGPD
jgi:hypothetical protein